MEIAQTTTVNRHAGNVTTTQPLAAFSSPRILIARIHVTNSSVLQSHDLEEEKEDRSI